MTFSTQSDAAALAANGKAIHVATPWHIVVDTDAETITVTKRNVTLIGVDEEVLAFRFIRNIKIDSHLIGADITIGAIGGSITAYCIPKKDAKQIRQIILEYNAAKGNVNIV